jgi:2-isopropylmalate synthase
MVRILDTTLREGEQTPGICFDLHIKIAIAELLDAIGIDFIEAGHPVVTDGIRVAVSRLAGRGLSAKIGAHARSLAADVEAALECGVQFLGIFFCVSDERLADRSMSLGRAVDQIVRVIRLAREASPALLIRYTPEDTVRSPFANVAAAAGAAADAGADIISVADTTGAMIPGTQHSLYEYVLRLKDALARQGREPAIAVHCHNDRGLALANALDGYRAGADILDASVLGLGERAGIVDLATLLAVLAGDFGEGNCWDLKRLPELYRLVSRFTRIAVPPMFPVTGAHAFTHCAGVHTQAAIRNPLHYQSLAPELVGRKPRIALDHMTGLAALEHSLETIGERDLSRDMTREILDRVKAVGQTGRTVNLRELALIVRALRKKEPAVTASGCPEPRCCGKEEQVRS